VLGSALVLLLALAAIAIGSASGSGSARAQSAAAGPLPGINLIGLGFGSTPADANHEIAAARSLHLKAVRIELPWSVLQPHGPGELDQHGLDYADRVIDEAKASGMAVILLVDATPCWATSAPKKLRHSCNPDKASPGNGYPPTQPSDFAAFVKELAGRYRDKITALEIWNEPDQANEIYFGGPNKAQRYAELVRAAYPAIKQADPNIKVLAGSLVGSNGVFLKALYAAGMKGYYDGLAVHFYTLTLAALREFRSIQVASGDATPLWLDEFGWSSCYPHKKVEEETACVTRAVQAQNVTNMYRALSKVPYLATDTLYKLEDSRTNQSGVMTLNEGRKPSFSALARVVLAPNASPSKVQLSLRSSHGQVIASGSGPFGDFMRLEAFQGSALRYRATFTLDRFNRFRLKLPRVLGAHLRVRVYQQWTGLAGGAQKSV
jgi:polysaccharide biosynthesis protein PslG